MIQNKARWRILLRYLGPYRAMVPALSLIAFIMPSSIASSISAIVAMIALSFSLVKSIKDFVKDLTHLSSIERSRGVQTLVNALWSYCAAFYLIWGSLGIIPILSYVIKIPDKTALSVIGYIWVVIALLLFNYYAKSATLRRLGKTLSVA